MVFNCQFRLYPFAPETPEIPVPAEKANIAYQVFTVKTGAKQKEEQKQRRETEQVKRYKEIEEKKGKHKEKRRTADVNIRPVLPSLRH
jgi:hypothetical protein